MFEFETTKERSDLMREIKPFNTKPEIILNKYLKKMGFKIKRNYRRLPGSPDNVLIKEQIAKKRKDKPTPCLDN